ncbi:MAG: putative transcriptional regulator [Candidatus Nitrosomirales archaeon]|jgi:predicted transcriptional regulator
MVSKADEMRRTSPVQKRDDGSDVQLKVPERYAGIKAKLLDILNPLETDLYILLLENGEKSIMEIADLINFDRTETYHLVSALQNKGVITAAFRYPIKFSAVPVNKVFKILSKTKPKNHTPIA